MSTCLNRAVCESGQEAGVVLAVSEAASGRCGGSGPTADFCRLACTMASAAVVGNQGLPVGPIVSRRMERAAALDINQALYVLRTYPTAEAYVSFSERVGIPLGAMLGTKKRRPAHIMIAHRLHTRTKRLLDVLTRWHSGVDKIITVCSAQLGYAQRILPGRASFIRQGADDLFYRPRQCEEEDYVLSVGSENRDYGTLIAAARTVGCEVKILASSPWCRKRAKRAEASSGERVTFLPRADHNELRDLYHRARLVVVPLNDVEYAAGLNGVLEALCANKPLMVSGSHGIRDYVRHLHNAYVVPTHDASAMAAALETTLTDDSLREQLRAGAREAVSEYANLGAYTAALQSEITRTIEEKGAR